MPANEVEIKLIVEDVLSKKYKSIANEIKRINKTTGKSFKDFGNFISSGMTKSID